MIGSCRRMLLALVGATIALAWAPAWAQQAGDAAGGVAAKVGEEIIRLDEVEKSLSAQLAQLEQQRFQLLLQRLDQLIAERLLAQEARRRSTSVEQLLKEEADARAPQVTDDEVTQFVNQNRGRLPPGDEADLRLKVRNYLRAQRLAQERQAYVDDLRQRTEVAVFLEESAATRVSVSDKGFARGPADAPVVIVEFSDFQCPFCRDVVPTVKRVLDRYPDKVRWVFRDFPIASIHPGAARAHAAARCAGAQGKFWEYHDILFERAPRHERDQLAQYAVDLKLDPSAFAECLDSGRHDGAVKADIEEGTALGVTGTPTFYVNGRSLVGALPFAAFQRIVESELRKKAGP